MTEIGPGQLGRRLEDVDLSIAAVSFDVVSAVVVAAIVVGDIMNDLDHWSSRRHGLPPPPKILTGIAQGQLDRRLEDVDLSIAAVSFEDVAAVVGSF